jgi:hypothetical protein
MGEPKWDEPKGCWECLKSPQWALVIKSSGGLELSRSFACDEHKDKRVAHANEGGYDPVLVAL